MNEILEDVDAALGAKINSQGGIPTIYDHRMANLISAARSGGSEGPTLRSILREIERYHSKIRGPRFAEPTARLARSQELLRQSMIPGFPTLSFSQGVASIPKWAGHLLFKTAFDCVIYPMLLAELAPRTVLELGSGAGGSAVWMADVTRAHGQRPRIISVDRDPVGVDDERIEFRRGDVFDIERVLPPEELAELEHPWLVVEDAHVNLRKVLAHIDSFIEPGDYLVVEDSYSKRAPLREFLGEARNKYMLDLAYLDMFGENSTCAIDSIFVAVDKILQS